MAITINGNGTIGGVSVGGLPDGIVDTDMLASNAVTSALLPAGSVLQVVDSGAQSTPSTSQSTTFIDGNCTASITPSSASSKIIVCVTQELQVWNNSNYATGRWKIQRNIGGGAFSDIYIDSSTANGNIFAYDYGGSGINIYRPTNYTLVDSPSSTSVVVYKTQIAQGSNGGNRISANQNSPGRMILMEIAG